MATKTIAWTTGSGNITLTYTGQGNGSISVASDENDNFDERSQSFEIVTTNGSPKKAISILVKQQGKKYAVGEVFNFDYTGSVQEITLPKGKYKLQCWGAQGGTSYGSSSGAGSKGGYSEGVLTLTKTTTLYVFVGGQGSRGSSTSLVNGGWNGGGASVGKSSYNSGDTNGYSNPACGGGATDISTVTSSMSYSGGRTNRSSASLLARCIVAGGGAGGSYRYTAVTSTTTQTTSSVVVNQQVNFGFGWSSGGTRYYYAEVAVSAIAGRRYVYGGTYSTTLTLHGEGLYDSSGNGIGWGYTPTSNMTIYARCYVKGDSNSTANGYANLKVTEYIYNDVTTTDTSSGYSNKSQQGGGTSGKGQYPGTQSSAGTGGGFGYGANQDSTNYRYCAGGGGGGWYGGGTDESDSSTNYVNYSGGGSGFVNIAANAASRPSGYTGLQLDSGTTKDGSTSFESTSGGTETGHSGNGYARITVLDGDSNGGDSGGSTPSVEISWDVMSGSWNSGSNSNAVDGTAYTSVSPGSSAETVIRCTFSGLTSITFNCVYNGESNYDYLTVGSLDTECTRSSYGTSLKGTSGTARDITFSCDTGTHFVEFCYSKDGSVDTYPDNATVYVKSYS